MSELSPDSPQIADAAASVRSAYVHIPFCRRRCPYCDFAVVTEAEGGVGPVVERYVGALLAEIAFEAPWGSLDAVNLGGGTPSTLSPKFLGEVLHALREQFGLAPDAEISLEANPEDWTHGYAEAVRAVGFTRVSFGVQSFDRDVLIALGRLHDPAQAVAAVRTARAVGFPTVGIDLIYGTPGETTTSWARTVQTALDLELDHLSAYGLTVERGTDLSRAVAAGAPGPDPDVQAAAWEHLAALAPEVGLVRYEVSNYARPGHPCLYNLATWAQGEYLGFGLGAHGHRDGVRRRNVRRLDRYLEAIEAGESGEAGRESPGPWDRELERLFLGVRRTAGVSLGAGGRRLLETEGWARLETAGVASVLGNRLVVEDALLTDEVVRSVLSLSPPEC